MSIITEHDMCIGCGVCKIICPKHAISLSGNPKGFLYPIVDNTKCIECGLCEIYCNAKNSINMKYANELKAAKHNDDDIRKISSSGGVFYALASLFIQKKGVVYGCKLDESLNALHTRAKTLEECKAFMGSKYVQSDMQHIIAPIIKDVSENKPVLFTGTSCQCAAIKRLLFEKGLEYKNIVFCEILCHGVPSPKIFHDFIDTMEDKYRGHIVSFTFRDKEKVKKLPSSRGMRMKIKKNNHLNSDKFLDIYNRKYNDIHYTMFKMNYVLRECCYNCQFTGFERVADLTIADYWGCDICHPEFFDRKGISLVLINTEQGKVVYSEISEQLSSINITEKEALQKPLLSPPVKPKDYSSFWEEYEKFGYWVTASKYAKQYLRRTPLEYGAKIIRWITPIKIIEKYKIRRNIKKYGN